VYSLLFPICFRDFDRHNHFTSIISLRIPGYEGEILYILLVYLITCLLAYFLTYLLIPWLYSLLTVLARLITEARSSLSTAFCCLNFVSYYCETELPTDWKVCKRHKLEILKYVMWQDSTFLYILRLPLLNPWNPRTTHDISSRVENTVAFRVAGAANTDLLSYPVF
jgi:hypothetical protein